MNSKMTYTRAEVYAYEECECTYCNKEMSVSEGIFFKQWSEEEYDFVCFSCKNSESFKKRIINDQQEIDDLLSEE